MLERFQFDSVNAMGKFQRSLLSHYCPMMRNASNLDSMGFRMARRNCIQTMKFWAQFIDLPMTSLITN